MAIVWAIAAFLFSLTAAAYLQIPTFILALGYGWSHAFERKRWILRAIALAAFIAFLWSAPPAWAIIATSLPSAFFWVFSLFNANPNIFRALEARHILKVPAPHGDGARIVVGLRTDDLPAIAYPLDSMVIPHHVLNDVVGGRPILISFCAACRSSIAYERDLDGRTLSFEVVGVRRRNMILRDRETGSIWQQATGEAVYGALRGRQLAMLPAQQMSQEDWLSCHPDSLIADEAPTAPGGLFPKTRLMRMLEVTKTLTAPGLTRLDGLAPRETVWGVTMGDASKAYPVSELRLLPHFRDCIGTSEVEIRYDPDTNRIEGWLLPSRTPIVLQSHWWMGWKEFHSNTEIWDAASATRSMA